MPKEPEAESKSRVASRKSAQDKSTEDIKARKGREPKPTQLLDAGFPNRIPVMPLLSVVVFPYSVMSFIVRKPHNLQLLEEIDASERVICLAGQLAGPDDKPVKLEDLYTIGVASRLIHSMPLPDGSVQVTFQGLARVHVKSIVSVDPYLRAEVEKAQESVIDPDNVETAALMATALKLFESLVNLNPSYSNELTMILKMNIEGPGRFADMIGTFVNFPLKKKHQLLGELDRIKRLKLLMDFLQEEIHKARIESEVQQKVQGEIQKTQRDYILRQQLETIRKELGESDDASSTVAALRKRMEEAGLPEHVAARCDEQLKRLQTMNPASPEFNVVQTYVDWLVSLPWSRSSDDNPDLTKARAILDAGHFGLESVKDRIVEFLAVLKLKGGTGGSILCLQGPPGVGKTSLGKGIAEALGRQFERLSVGGLRDDSEIMGHRRTYVGALPGKIIGAMKRAGTINPIIMIDEIDKMGSDFRGDPASAMLEVLDPSQNWAFQDRYLEVPYDLSKVFFICTSNVLESIPRPLLDRMEVIRLAGYTHREKYHIAVNHLLARQLEANGITRDNLDLADDALNAIIDGYTREAGVRNLERTIGTVCRKIALKIATGDRKKVRVNRKNLADFLGPQKVQRDPRLKKASVGVATGMAWTAVGGEILFIEATKYPGSGKVTVTGSLGNVMKESVQTALSFVRAHAGVLGVEGKKFDTFDIHVHFPEGATPKDGPSAGVAIVTAITSLFTDRKILPEVAMTGEVTLQGRVLAIGGVKEKVLGAQRAGITTVLLPEANRRDYDEVPEEVRATMTAHFTSMVFENLKHALMPADKAPASTPSQSANPADKAKTAKKTAKKAAKKAVKKTARSGSANKKAAQAR